MYACRTCQYSETAKSACVYRNDLSNTVGETAGVTQDVGADPTVGLPGFCTLCGQEMACEICGLGLTG
jgi:DNA-directed RNA polymerase II subunit RPB9